MKISNVNRKKLIATLKELKKGNLWEGMVYFRVTDSVIMSGFCFDKKYGNYIIEAKIDATPEVGGDVAIPVKKLIEALSVMTSEVVNLQRVGNTFLVTAVGEISVDFWLPSESLFLKLREILEVEDFSGVYTTELPYIKYADILAVSKAKETNRPILTGVNFIADPSTRSLWLATADGYQLSVVNVPDMAYSHALNVTLSGQGVLQAFKLFTPKTTCSLAFGKAQAKISVAEYTFYLLYFEGKFPDYFAVMPDYNSMVVDFGVDTANLQSHVAKAKYSAAEHVICLTYIPTGYLKVEGKTNREGYEYTMDTEYTYKDMEEVRWFVDGRLLFPILDVFSKLSPTLGVNLQGNENVGLFYYLDTNTGVKTSIYLMPMNARNYRHHYVV